MPASVHLFAGAKWQGAERGFLQTRFGEAIRVALASGYVTYAYVITPLRVLLLVYKPVPRSQSTSTVTVSARFWQKLAQMPPGRQVDIPMSISRSDNH